VSGYSAQDCTSMSRNFPVAGEGDNVVAEDTSMLVADMSRGGCAIGGVRCVRMSSNDRGCGGHASGGQRFESFRARHFVFDLKMLAW
jgi:hypothetical protein